MIAKRLKMIEFDIKKRLIFENNDFIAVVKYSGESFHNDDQDKVGFFNLVKQAIEKEIFSVHRLDKGTSGIMLFALNKSAQKRLLDMFSKREINKTYIALSRNKPKKKQGNIVGDLVKSRGGNYKLSFEKTNPSITRFKSFQNGELFFFLYSPKTGRTHQIRVVAKSLKSPILGDERYGAQSAKRMFLHCLKLSFIWNDKKVEIINRPSEDEFLIFKDYFNEEIK